MVAYFKYMCQLIAEVYNERNGFECICKRARRLRKHWDALFYQDLNKVFQPKVLLTRSVEDLMTRAECYSENSS